MWAVSVRQGGLVSHLRGTHGHGTAVEHAIQWRPLRQRVDLAGNVRRIGDDAGAHVGRDGDIGREAGDLSHPRHRG